MPQRQRPSLSAPSYGAYTGRINWSRGMDERLASGTSYAPPVAQPTITTAAPTTSSNQQNAFLASKMYALRHRNINQF